MILELEGLAVFGRHGVLEEERRDGQEFLYDIGLDVVSGGVREIGATPVLSNSFGFGGHNAALILAPVE